jgi:hypothetical protein
MATGYGFMRRRILSFRNGMPWPPRGGEGIPSKLIDPQ